MKKEFDIKYRSEIESGKYRVETITGLPVRIICWNAKSGNRDDDIIALVGSDSGAEKIQRYYSNGQLISDSARVGRKDLCLVPNLKNNVEEVYQLLVAYIMSHPGCWGDFSRDDIIIWLNEMYCNYITCRDIFGKNYNLENNGNRK